MSVHEGLKRVRKRRKRSRKLRDNRELLFSVIMVIVGGVLFMGFLTYLISTRACHTPRFLQ